MSKSKMGRPTKEEALAKAIEAFGGAGIPIEAVDPVAILAAIAANPNSSESGRLRACMALVSDDVLNYQLRKRDRERDDAMNEAMRRQYEDADEAGRAQMVDRAKTSVLSAFGLNG